MGLSNKMSATIKIHFSERDFDYISYITYDVKANLETFLFLKENQVVCFLNEFTEEVDKCENLPRYLMSSGFYIKEVTFQLATKTDMNVINVWID